MARVRYKFLHLRPDKTYSVQMRGQVNGVYGKYSPVFKFTTTVDETPPGPPRNVQIGYEGSELILTWDAPEDVESGDTTDFSHYHVYIVETSSGDEELIKVEDTTARFSLQFLKFIFSGLTGSYSFRVTALDHSGNESTPESVSFSAVAPAPFNMLSFTSLNQSIKVEWEESVDNDLSHYNIYRNGQLAGRTIGTELEFIDGNPGSGEHSYYAVAVDAFGLTRQSNNTLTGATSFGYWQGDGTVPSTPTLIDVQSTVSSADGSLADATVSFQAPVTNADASDYEDHNEFIIQYSKLVSGPWQSISVPDDRVAGTTGASITARINDLSAGTEYHFRVAAKDRYSNRSAWGTASHTTVVDVAAPSIPAAPTAAANLLRVQVTHDLTKQGGGALESDVRSLKVYVGTSGGFTADASTYVGTMDVPDVEGFTATGSFSVDSVTKRYVKVSAVDASGNESGASLSTDAGAIQLITDLHVEAASITTASIGSLSVSKLVAGDGVVNNFDVKALLTVGTGGTVQSENFVANTSGYRLSEAGLEIYDGTVSAKALTINNSPNLIPWKYATFEGSQTYYFGGTDSDGNAVQSAFVFNAEANTSVIATGGWVGESKLTLKSKAGTGEANRAQILFTESTSQYNVDVEAGSRYIVSFYSTAPNTYSVYVKARWKDSVTTENEELIVIPVSTDWRRNSVVFTAPTGATEAYFGVETANPNVTVHIDAVQVELVTSSVPDGQLVPAAWKSPSMTEVDGGLIKTGEIRSTNYVPSTSGWRVGMEGNASFNNVFARGTIQATAGYLQDMSVYNTITVGNASNDTTSQIKSYNGNWYIRGDGYLYAANASVSGNLNATSGTFQGITAYSINVGGPGISGYIQSLNYNGWSSGGGYSGWRINSDGTAYFNSAYIRGQLNADDIVAGTITGERISGGTITGVVLQSGTSGRRVRVESDKINLYRDDGALGGWIQGESAGYGVKLLSQYALLLSAANGIYFDTTLYTQTRDIDMGATGGYGGELRNVRHLKVNIISGRTGGETIVFNNPITVSTINGNSVVSPSHTHSPDHYHNSSTALVTDSLTVREIIGEGGGSIRMSNSLNFYNTRHIYNVASINSDSHSHSSSRRIKDEIRPLARMESFDNISTYSYKLKSSGERQYGFIAEELQAQDETLSDGKAVYPTSILAITVKELQEVKKKVATLEVELAELKRNK